MPQPKENSPIKRDILLLVVDWPLERYASYYFDQR